MEKSNDNFELCNLCHDPDAASTLWVQCELCPQWVHVECVSLANAICDNGEDDKVFKMPKNESEIATYTCNKHEGKEKLVLKRLHKRKRQLDGNKEFKKKYTLRNNKSLDYALLNEGEDKKFKHAHSHLEEFKRCFSKWENTTNVINAARFKKEFNSINIPYKISDPENSGMETPKPKQLDSSNSNDVLNVQNICDALGDDHPVEVMDVQTQQNERWTLSRWNDYFTHTKAQDRERLKNVISLEVSDEEGFPIERPLVVTENDLVNQVWELHGPKNNPLTKPKVTKYVLMSVSNAFTDFHLDFAGTCVYYNVIYGRKQFILFPPTEKNLGKYVEWSLSVDQSSTFLGNVLEDGIAMELTAGDLFMIPCGYIHVVYTPEDSLVIGGNFLTYRDLEMHLKIVEIEKKTMVPVQFTFPAFKNVMMYTAEMILSNTEKQKMIPLKALDKLIEYLKKTTTSYSSSSHSSKSKLVHTLEAVRVTRER